jgi:competence protein ComEC
VALAAAVPGAVVHLPAPPPLAVASYVGGLALLVFRKPRAAAILLAVALGAGAWPLVRPPDARLRVTVLDVGQGDAIVAEMPDGRAILVDAGSGGARRLDAGERVVAPFLWNRGFLRLARAVVTHDDSDHAGGMPAVRRLLRVDEQWTSLDPPATPRAFGGVVVTALPRLATGGRRNDGGLVLRLEVGWVSFLLASDIEAARERELLDAGLPLAATVLKVAHHGSRSSTTAEFVRAVRPAVAVISVGPRNAYGHPDSGVLARLTETGARIYRTDRDGAVILETDGHTLSVTRWASRRVDRICVDPEAIC